jgi:hypothetical protein
MFELTGYFISNFSNVDEDIRKVNNFSIKNFLNLLNSYLIPKNKLFFLVR